MKNAVISMNKEVQDLTHEAVKPRENPRYIPRLKHGGDREALPQVIACPTVLGFCGFSASPASIM